MSKKERVPPPSEGKRAAIYCRKSDLKEESQGKSVDQQLEKCQIAARALGFDVDERNIYIDKDGNKGWWHFRDPEGRNPPPYREELSRLMSEVSAGNIDTVICWRSDRCYRDEVVGAFFLRALRSKGVRFFAQTVDFQIHTLTGYDNAMADALRNRSYSDRVSDDVWRNHEALAKAGEPYKDVGCHGFRSAGLKTRKAIAIESELTLVRLAFELYCYGPPGGAPLSANSIAAYLMDKGMVVSVGAKGHKVKDQKRIESGQITSILRNRAYIAEQVWDGQIYPCNAFLVPGAEGALEPVVPRHVFDLAQEMLSKADPYEKDRRAKLLSGIVVCPCCGRKMNGQSRGSKFARSLTCQRRSGLHRTCWGKSYRTFNMADLEEWVKKHLAFLVTAELQAMKSEKAGHSVRRDLVSAEAQLSDLRNTEARKLVELATALDSDQIGSVAAEFRRQREALQNRVAELRRLLQAESAPDTDPFDLLSANDGVLRAALLRSVRWIAITPKGIIVLTKAGAYIAAPLVKPSPKFGLKYQRPLIGPPSMEASQNCLSWIKNGARFLEGVRIGTGHRYHLPEPDDVLCPEYPDLGLVYGREVDEDPPEKRIRSKKLGRPRKVAIIETRKPALKEAA